MSETRKLVAILVADVVGYCRLACAETLEKLIKRSGRLEVKFALEIANQVAGGLAAIHEQNLVHRDIKPTNTMVRLKKEGGVTAKIIDLGLAKTVDESASEAGISSPGTWASKERRQSCKLPATSSVGTALRSPSWAAT
jgi:serine/threonine protein kinase